MTHDQARQYGESRPMPDIIDGQRKSYEFVYVSRTGFKTREEAWKSFQRLHAIYGGNNWLSAFDENEGIFRSSDDGKFYVYMHRSMYV